MWRRRAYQRKRFERFREERRSDAIRFKVFGGMGEDIGVKVKGWKEQEQCKNEQGREKVEKRWTGEVAVQDITVGEFGNGDGQGLRSAAIGRKATWGGDGHEGEAGQRGGADCDGLGRKDGVVG